MNRASPNDAAAIFELDAVSHAVPGRQIPAPLSLALAPGRIAG